MSSTHWNVAFRTLARDKAYALINVVWVTLPIACVTAALQLLKATRAQPVRASRYE